MINFIHFCAEDICVALPSPCYKKLGRIFQYLMESGVNQGNMVCGYGSELEFLFLPNWPASKST